MQFHYVPVQLSATRSYCGTECVNADNPVDRTMIPLVNYNRIFYFRRKKRQIAIAMIIIAQKKNANTFVHR